MARLGQSFQFRRNTKATIQAASGTVFAAGEPVWATDTGELFIANGSTTPASVSRSFNGVGNPGSGNLTLPFNMISTTTAAQTSGTLALYPIDIWPGPLAIKALACNVTTAQVAGTGTLTQAVLYSDAGNGNGPAVTPASLIANVAVTSTSLGVKLTTVSLTLTPGRYWAGLLYYQGTTAPTTVPAYTSASNGTTLWNVSTAFALTNCLRRTGLTSVPTDSVAFTPTQGTAPIVALQAT